MDSTAMSGASGDEGMSWYPAPAKLNLCLHVLGRRADGYHELQTVFRLVSLADEVGIGVRADGQIRREHTLPGVAEKDDLCVRAARLLREHALTLSLPSDTLSGADIRLRKRIPMGGGLGGGSSDAATVLLVLNRQWQLNLGREALMALALQLGADVPFFLFGRNAVGEGVGERLSALSLEPAWYLILIPQVSVSTKEIFSSPALTRNTKPLKIPPFLPGLGRNDLEPVATALYPEVAVHLNWFLQRATLGMRGTARMTGSGACVFAEFASQDAAQAVAAQLPEGMRGVVAQGLEQHPLYDWL